MRNRNINTDNGYWFLVVSRSLIRYDIRKHDNIGSSLTATLLMKFMSRSNKSILLKRYQFFSKFTYAQQTALWLKFALCYKVIDRVNHHNLKITLSERKFITS